MKSLFARILVWFLATAAVAVVGFVIVSAIVASAGGRAHAPVLRPLRFLGGEAVHAYEEGGSVALADALARIDTAYDFEGRLTDSDGRSLSGTGEDYSLLVGRARSRRVFADTARGLLVFSVPIQGRRGSYWFFLEAPIERFGFWFRVRQTVTLPHLWVLACVILLSYALARHLTKPVLKLRAAAERLGQGDFSARVRSTRQDELGELARTFDGMAERIEHAVTAQRQLLQDVSHELRSPLSRLGVAVELARSSPNPSEALDRVNREAERLNDLVTELLSMTREEPRLSPVNLAALLAEVVDEAQIEAGA
ncbi:MAG TPA: HAMP domain-containing protein, partial [Bryobacterales bacterium]|nr:HAMP domain-containing protein [Bryobacterales bacterium]